MLKILTESVQIKENTSNYNKNNKKNSVILQISIKNFNDAIEQFRKFRAEENKNF